MQKMDQIMARKTTHRGRRNTLLVHGMGGTGKTQLVLQYVEEHRTEYSVTLWLDATTRESFVWSCFLACKSLRLTSSDSQSDTHEALVPQRSPAVNELLAWLHERPSSGKWLVVLDNVDDLNWGIKDVFPRGMAGSVIVTSRDSYVSRAFGCPKITLESMEVDEASAFLRVAAFPDLEESSNELDALCAKVSTLVDCLPLAVHLAAATIQTSPQIISIDDPTVDDACEAIAAYIDRFEDKKDILLMRDDSYQFMQTSYPRTVLTTFETTFDKLRGERRPLYEPPAMTLLAMLAFMGEENVVDVHMRFQQAYSGILAGHNSYATRHMKKWLSKILTGESSVAYLDQEQTEWDHHGYCETLGALHRYGLIRIPSKGLPEILPLHKIVRWRVQKEEEDEMRSHLEQYAVLLELALASKTIDETDLVRTLNELADLYVELGFWQYAETCRRLHLMRQIHSVGRQHAVTVASLEKLLEILIHRKFADEVEHEVFMYVKDAPDRQAVLEALPANLLLLLNRMFKKEHATNWTRSFPEKMLPPDEGQEDDQNPFAAPINTLVGLPASKSPMAQGAAQLELWRPTLEAPGLPAQISSQIAERKLALLNSASKPPDLVTMFEVLAMGSSELLSRYMHHIDEDMVHYCDPVAGRTVLHFIAAYGQPQDVARCIEKGSDISARDRYGSTPLHVAGMQGRPEVFKALVDANGDTKLKDNHGKTPLQYASQRPLLLPSVDHLIERPALKGPPQNPSTTSPELMALPRPAGNNAFSLQNQAYVESDDSSSDDTDTTFDSESATFLDPEPQYLKHKNPFDPLDTSVPHSFYAPPSMLTARKFSPFTVSPLRSSKSTCSGRSSLARDDESRPSQEERRSIEPQDLLSDDLENRTVEPVVENTKISPASADQSSMGNRVTMPAEASPAPKPSMREQIPLHLEEIDVAQFLIADPADPISDKIDLPTTRPSNDYQVLVKSTTLEEALQTPLSPCTPESKSTVKLNTDLTTMPEAPHTDLTSQKARESDNKSDEALRVSKTSDAATITRKTRQPASDFSETSNGRVGEVSRKGYRRRRHRRATVTASSAATHTPAESTSRVGRESHVSSSEKKKRRETPVRRKPSALRSFWMSLMGQSGSGRTARNSSGSRRSRGTTGR